ncbi:MAG: DUF3299 domain-containing protein [Geminicoccaceae bacterium]|nr:DUF3299 domain-containing protein [Geminicoccaceae bacterium]MCS7267622.1 DUF3299 domain-containing protein [Geminicoccaceae bacterium]MCX7630415.1 DUF3299 domain-containing protein [Geminicoccaceae bacterium]MDW8123180.1 DUF3299 domain-containing protein [Geminicoccaceae bacterium]MDW8340160.1 DUF3299 domain-containing protein [Geminicoccaceae bacterium]
MAYLRALSFSIVWLALAAGTASGFVLQPGGVPGVRDHDPARLARAGVVSWDVLRELDIVYETKGPGMTDFRTQFTSALEQLDGKRVRLAGFIYPTEAAETYTRFLLSAYPANCPFCLPGGATELVEVRAAAPIRFTYDPLILEGRFELLRDDPSGLLYRLHDARPVTLD